METFIAENEVSVIFYGEEKSDEWKTYITVAREFDDIEFAHVNDAELKKSEASQVVLHKKFDELRNEFTQETISQEALQIFIA